MSDKQKDDGDGDGADGNSDNDTVADGARVGCGSLD